MNRRIGTVGSLAVLGAVVMLGSCDNSGSSPSGSGSKSPASTPAPKTPPPATTPAKPTPAPADAGAEIDRKITADVRSAIAAKPGMSMNAQLVKITTKNAVVTLEGTVDSQGEKDAVESAAKAVPGVASVVNKLEVKTAAPEPRTPPPPAPAPSPAPPGG